MTEERPIRSTKPHDRLTRLCAAMTKALEAQPEYAHDVRCIVFLQDENKGGIQLHGYDDETEAIVDVFLHLRAMFRSQGKDLMFAPIGGTPDVN